MITKTDYDKLLKRIDDLNRELEDIRQMLLQEKQRNQNRSKEAWESLKNLSAEVSAKWKGPPATKEIRDQRDKRY